MTHGKIAAAVAAALAAGAIATPASAAFFEPWTVTGAETYTVRLSGATAQDKGIPFLMRRLCAVGTMVRVTGTVDSAILCEANGVDSAPIAAGTKLVLYKNSNGGSSRGVNPVADRSTTITFLNLASLGQAGYQNASVCTVTTFASTADFADYKEYACGANVTSPTGTVPDAGISDIEPSLLGYVQGVNGAIESKAGPLLTFGVPVSENFRNALQAAQASQLAAGCVVGSDAPECMPSLTKAQIASIYNGGIAAVARLSSELGVALANPAGGGGLSICRRKVGSGTQASSNVYFLNDGCVKSTQGVKGIATGGVDGNAAIPSVASRINEYSSTPQVIGCLNANHTANKYAIGVASMEFVPGSAYLNTGLGVADGDFDDDPGHWGWIRVSGAAPTLLDTQQGRYDFAMELSYQRRVAPNTLLMTADQIAFYNKVSDTNLSPLVLKEVNTGFTQVGGWAAGFLGAPSVGTPTDPSAAPAGALTEAEVVANPISTWARSTATGKPNSCQPAYTTRQSGLERLIP
jgi:hypothetical protein